MAASRERTSLMSMSPAHERVPTIVRRPTRASGATRCHSTVYCANRATLESQLPLTALVEIEQIEDLPQ
eukprot:1118700-Prymnesium_polylepis.1